MGLFGDKRANMQARNEAGLAEQNADIENRGFDPRDPTATDAVAATVNRERAEDALGAELSAHAKETYVDAGYDEGSAPDMAPASGLAGDASELPPGVHEMTEAELIAEEGRFQRLTDLQEGRLQEKLDAAAKLEARKAAARKGAETKRKNSMIDKLRKKFNLGETVETEPIAVESTTPNGDAFKVTVDDAKRKEDVAAGRASVVGTPDPAVLARIQRSNEDRARRAAKRNSKR